MTTVTAAPGMRVVQDVEIEEFRQGGRVYDRRVTVVFECGHRKQMALPIDAPVDVVAGGLSRCLSCSCGVRS